MELKHQLTYNGTTTVIDEPIGFDNLKMTMKRHEYHGMSAEVSLDNLEFYGQAFSIIKQAYETDIDSKIMYTVLADSEEIYSGTIDLSTYSLKQGDYQSISVKVGEIGVKTTFNNRLDTEVDLNKCETIDGIAFKKPKWLNLHIPSKRLLYTNLLKQKQDQSFGIGKGTTGGSSTAFILDNAPTNEFGNVNSNGLLFHTTSDFEDTFGNNTELNIEANVTIEIEELVANLYNAGIVSKMSIRLLANGTVIAEQVFASSPIMVGEVAQLEYKGKISTAPIQIEIFCITTANNAYFWNASAIIRKGSYVKMTMCDNLEEKEPVNADMLLVHDALNVVAQAISEKKLTVKSSWYQAPESKWNAGTLGGGALKALTNGYKIRGLFTDEDNNRNMSLTFKDLIKSLNAQDCIGWGFSTELEIDTTHIIDSVHKITCVRVERWDWFYQDDVILTLDNVAEVQTDIDPDRIITELTIGYKKYATNDQYNSIESPHGTRTFVNGIKAVSNAVSAECEFIADNYAIEETRRATTQKNETEESSYDENIFIFELVKKLDNYSIGHTGYSASKIGNENEFINAKLTPRHMASRWRDFLFAANNTSPFKFTSGELNYDAAFIVLPTYLNAQYSLQPFEGSVIKMRESDNIKYQATTYKAEKISFSYPLTVAEYATVKANPYGLVSVNGQQGWILDFKYSFADGLAEFVLLAKY